MLKIGEQDAVNILRFFDDLPDPRSEVNRLHRLGDVIVIAICAVIANADGPTAIAKWAKLNQVWLKKHLALPNGITGKDTFRRVLGLLRPAAFQECFQRWLESLSLAGDDESGDKRHVAIDMLCPGSLYPRVFTEGMFGIVPTGLDSFECTPWLPQGWPRMVLRDVRAFGRAWDLVVERADDQQRVTVTSGGRTVMTAIGPAGTTYSVNMASE